MTSLVRRGLTFLSPVLAGLMLSSNLCAEVAVLSNRTTTSHTVQVIPLGKPKYSLSIGSGDSRPLFFSRAVRIQLDNSLVARELPLAPSSAYFFTKVPGQHELHLEKIGLGPQDYVDVGHAPSKTKLTIAEVVIPVKILVDDDEPTHRKVWEPRLRKRIAEASKVLKQHCGIALKVVAVAKWESTDSHHDFSKTLREFERRVVPEPAALAIGFSSQYELTRGRTHMGGTRGPLHPYILLKERARRIRETERLELLVHELGHYLGASHSPEPHSVMRPLLTGGLQRRVGSRIQFDPVNTLLMSLLADEMRQHDVRHLTDVSTTTKARMLEIYHTLRPTLPEDPAAGQFERLLAASTSPDLVDDTREVMRQLVLLAQRQNQQQNAQEGGDALTQHYVRRAAEAAIELPKENATKAMLLALGIFIDNSDTLRRFAPTRTFVARVESNRERRTRLEKMGTPTMRGRADLAKHFFVSAHALIAMGPQASRTLGLAKEMLDAQQGTGFSFADMAANRAGIVFAERLLDGRLSLNQIAQSFVVDDYLPEISQLEEGLRVDTLQARFGRDSRTNLLKELMQIEQHIEQMPAYGNE